MIIHNKWTGGDVEFRIPPLPPEYMGISGAVFQTFTFDTKIGEETALLLLDDPEFSRQLGSLKPFNLFTKTGMVRTSAGIIAFVVWTITSKRGHVVDYEHTLNPFSMKTIRMISGISQQTHLKVLIVDSYESNEEEFFEFQNNFELDKLAAGIAQCVGNEPEADFAKTQAALREEFTLEEMKGMG